MFSSNEFKVRLKFAKPKEVVQVKTAKYWLTFGVYLWWENSQQIGYIDNRQQNGLNTMNETSLKYLQKITQ